jgi:two-component system cell cycle sensor histidine kinase/response regulator CckA
MSTPSPVTVLHVDDDATNRELLGWLLRAHGFVVHEAATGAAALLRAAEGPDVVLLDVCLPDLSGFDVCRRLKSDPATAHIPVLQLSGERVSSADRVAGLEGGADAYLTKPVEARELVAQIRALVRVRRAEDELRQRVRQQAAIAELSQLALGSVDLAHWLHETVARVAALLGADYGAVWEPAADGASLLLRAGVGWKEGHVGRTTVSTDAHSHAGYTLRANEPVVVADMRAESRFQVSPLLAEHGVVSGLSVIVRGGTGAFGVLSVYTTRPRTFSRADVDFLQSAANLLAVALQRQRSEETMRWLAAMVESSDDAIIGKTLDGVITSWNAGAVRTYGYTAAEAVGRPIGLLAPPDRAGETADILGRLRQGNRIEQFETVRVRKDGKAIQVSLTISPVCDAAGRPVGATTIARDVSERKALEEQLRQAQKMEAIGHLAGGVAHDFNNLLTVITGYSDLLLARLPGADPAHHLVGEIRKAGDRAAALVRQLLAFGRKTLLQPIVLDLNGVVAETERMCRRLIGEDVELVTSLAGDLGKVRADPVQVQQVLLNLVVNARDAMPTGGRLTIETSNAELDDTYARTHVEVRPGAYVLLVVSDTGCGMTPEVKAHTFEPFFTTKEIGKGTGLGLAMVHGVVKQSGGHIEVDSEVGRGTTFRIYLPRLEQAAADSRPNPAEVVAPGGRETVLLAEDEAGVRTLARMILESNGYTVLAAGTPGEATDLAARHEGALDLLVTDVIMPQMNGRQLAGLLRTLHPGLKVLYISGYDPTGLHEGVLGPGTPENGTAFLEKPFTPTALARKVRELLDTGPARTSWHR